VAHAPAAGVGAFRVDAAPAFQGVVDIDAVSAGVVIEGVQCADAAAGGVGHFIEFSTSAR
jgi:hypothetical protein